MTFFNKTLFSASCLGLSVLFVPVGPAFAEEGDKKMMQELQKLKAQLAEMDNLQQRMNQLETQLAAQKTEAEPDPKSVVVKLKPALSAETVDGTTSFALEGRIMVDSGTVMDDGDSDLADATDLRAAWFGMKGQIDTLWKYRLLIGLDHESVGLKDAYVSYTGFENADVTGGHFFENNGLEIMSGSLHTMFMERSSGITTFRELRRIGVSVDPYGENWGAQLGIFGTSPDDDGTDDEGTALSGRVHFAPINEKNHVLHLGVNGSYRKTDGGNDSVRFRSRGESRVISERLIDTGTITGVEDYQQYGLEAMYHYGPFSLHSEYLITDLNRNTGANPTFTGGYVSTSYFLTGENRGYKAKRGTYSRVKPNEPFSLNGGGSGAWELAARYSTVDLNDGGINGGQMDAYTLGMNWYPSNSTKFMFNYVYNDLDEHAVYADTAPQYVMLRAQVDF